jgi:putative addiction module component (TIGR02574 family)
VTAAKKVLEIALALPEEERAAIVDALNDSLESRKPTLGPGWAEEIERRISAVERGESRLIPGDEVTARVRKALRTA